MIRETSLKTRIGLGAAALAVAGAGAYGITALNNGASADTENCVTHGEYDQTDVFMSVPTIESIYDVNGVFVDTPSEDTFARVYRSLCWTDTEEIRIAFDQQSGLSINWRVQDK
jgi:uridylate kinase